MKLRNIWKSIVGFFTGKIDPQIEQYATEALKVTTNMRKWMLSPLAVAITDLIPTDWDDKVRERLIAALETVVPALQIVDECKGKPFDEMLKCWLDNLSKLPPSIQAAILQKCQALLTAIQDGKEEKQNLYDMVSQYVYSKESKKND